MVSLPRRTVLAGAAAITLAGCLGDDHDDPEEEVVTDDENDYPDPADDRDEDDDDTDPAGDDDDATDTDDAEDVNGAAATVTVGPDGEHRFEPETLEIEVGGTVEFHWDDGGHNILIDAQPADGDWDGVEDTQEAGYAHTHTFGVEGRFEYYCGPHAGQGMTGAVHAGDITADDGDDAQPGGGY